MQAGYSMRPLGSAQRLSPHLKTPAPLILGTSKSIPSVALALANVEATDGLLCRIGSQHQAAVQALRTPEAVSVP